VSSTVSESVSVRRFVVAFAGNPNVGKSALINALAGSRLKVGNWPGVTVEKKEALLHYQGCELRLIDLPGTYSLSPYTLEERVCRNYLLSEPPDLIVNVVDSNNLHKNLYLTTQLLDTGIPVVLALNMWDEFQTTGYQLDQSALSEAVGVPVIPTSGVRKQGLEALLEAILNTVAGSSVNSPIRYPEAAEAFIQTRMQQAHMPRWLVIQQLENEADQPPEASAVPDATSVPHQPLDRPELLFAQIRTHFIQQLLTRILHPPQQSRKDLTDQIDQFLLNEWTGLPAFLLVLFLVFKLTFDISAPLIDFTDGFFNGFMSRWVSIALQGLQLPDFLVSLVTQGVIGGAGLVLSFVPVLVFLYLFLALLEESGYMARAAFLMDRFMFRFGLHGRAFVPLLVGFGCNVPAVYASRALENETDRKITVAILSFMSCGAKLPIYALFTSVFFVRNQALIILLLYVLGVAVAIFWAVVLRRTRFRSEIPAFIMELPPYRWPAVKMLKASIWLKTRAFIQQAGTVIALAMVVLWCLVNLPYGVPVQQTLLARSAQFVSPLFLPLGFGEHWEPVAAILPGFMAKEMVVGTLGVVLSVQTPDVTPATSFQADVLVQCKSLVTAGKTIVSNVLGQVLPSTFVLEQPATDTPLAATLRSKFTPLSAFAYLVFNLLLLSCISVMGAVTHEFGVRYLGFIFLLTTGTAYVAAALVYHLGRLLGLGV
jgi:ferrous iron transport protein B